MYKPMITNVSIKFNSIEEYREIERTLEGLGYCQDLLYQDFMIKAFEDKKGAYEYQVYINDGEFLIDSVLGGVDRIYNSLQEFLNDYMKKQRLMNIYENLNENISLSLKEVDALLDIAFGICSRAHENGECFWITSEMRVIYYILTKVKNAKDISEMKEDCEINLYKYFRE